MQAQNVVETEAATWRFKLGIAIFIFAFALYLLIPLAAVMKVSAGMIAALTGALLIGNKVLLLVVIAVLGKSGFQQLKHKVLGYVTVLAPTRTVGPIRHWIGVIMFCLPLLSSFLEPYIDAIAPGLRPNRWELQLLGDVLLVASFFVLGGNFWDKVRALFVRTAQIVDDTTAA